MPEKFEVVRDYVRTARGTLEILSRATVGDLSALLHALGRQYGVPLVGPNYDNATIDEVARAAAKNLENLHAERHYIRGLGAYRAAEIDGEIRDLAGFLAGFELRQVVERNRDRLLKAIAEFRTSELTQPGWAGAALRRDSD